MQWQIEKIIEVANQLKRTGHLHIKLKLSAAPHNQRYV